MKKTLTEEQSADLIKLGVDATKASKEIAETIYEQEYNAPRHPIFTLTDLLGMLPKRIMYRDEPLWLKLGISEYRDLWYAGYENFYDNDEADTFQYEEELVDCLYLLLKHLLNEKLVKL